MGRIIREAGKVYNLDDNGVITEASLEETQIENVPAPLLIGDRVSVNGQAGFLRARTDSIYGDALAIEFDDGRWLELPTEVVSHSDAEHESTYAETVDIHKLTIGELRDHFRAYNALPMITTEELDTKERVAKSVSLRAKYLLHQSSLSLEDQVDLDTIAMMADNDIKDMDQLRHSVEMSENDLYRRSSSSRYQIAENITSYGPVMGSHGEDASWLANSLDGMEVTEVTDADMATAALEMVAKLDLDQLDDDSTMQDASQFKADYLGILNDKDRLAKFERYVTEARQEKLAQPVVVKEAKVEEDLAAFDTSALFMEQECSKNLPNDLIEPH